MSDDLYKKQTVRWVDADGRRCMPTTPGATRRIDLSRKWYATVGGKATPLSSDKAAARKMLNQLRAKADQASVGLADPCEQQRKRPLDDHLADFEEAMYAKGNTPFHVGLVVSRVRALLDGCAFVMPVDLDAARAGQWLSSMRADRPLPQLAAGKFEWKPGELAELLGISGVAIRQAIERHGLPVIGRGRGRRYPRPTVESLVQRAGRGASAQTVNHYLRAVRSFLRWMVRVKRLPGDPLESLSLLNVSTDRRHDRRELEADELRRLLEAARASERIFRGLAGEARFHLYACACGTGFRASALAGLVPQDFNLDGDTATVTLPARLAKNRRVKVQPLPPEVADLLRAYLVGKPASQPIWGGTWASDNKAAQMLRIDLEAAGIPYAIAGPDGPLYADFHALRHSYITALGRGGVDLRTAQELAGHSSPLLTARYSHRKLYDLAGAVEKLPAFLPDKSAGPGSVSALLLPSGTDNTGRGCSMVAQPPVRSVHPVTAPGIEDGGNEEGVASPQPLTSSSLDTSSHPVSSVHQTGLEPVTFGSVASCTRHKFRKTKGLWPSSAAPNPIIP